MNITVCDPPVEAPSGDIRICDPPVEAPSGDIRLCNQDTQDPCNVALNPLSVSGDADCNVGDIYTASGGLGPYTWSFDGGTIDAGAESTSAEITAINACGAPGSSRIGTITVTDSCGNSATLEVRLTGGTWGASYNDPSLGTYWATYTYCTPVYVGGYGVVGNRRVYELAVYHPKSCADLPNFVATGRNGPFMVHTNYDYGPCANFNKCQSYFEADPNCSCGFRGGYAGSTMPFARHIDTRQFQDWVCP